MEVVARQALRLRKSCAKRNVEWSELSLAITELADAVEALEVDDHRAAVIDHLLPLALEFGDLLRNIRSKLVSDACEQLGRIVKTTQLAFTPLANALLESLAGTAKASSLAIRTPGFQLFSDVSEYSRYDLQSVHRVYRTSPQERVKSILVEQMQIVLASWPKSDIEIYYHDMLEVMRRGMRDPSSHVRTACRQTFCSFSDMWQERLHELVDIPTPPARDLLVKEKPHAAITKAIREKFNVGRPKESRVDSLRQQRGVVRRQGSSTAEEEHDSVFVEVKENTRRPLQRSRVLDSSKRVPSPARGSTRGASPSSATRTTSSSTRAPSPSTATRTASPSRAAVRGVSPSGLPRDAGNAAGRAPSPGRGQRIQQAQANNQASVSPPLRARNSEHGRYLNSTMLEEKTSLEAVQDENDRPMRPITSKNQKHVSIIETPSFIDSTATNKPRSSQLRAPLVDISSRLEQDSPFPRFSTTNESHREHSQPTPTDMNSTLPKNRFAAAALDFVSQPQARRFSYDNQEHDSESTVSAVNKRDVKPQRQQQDPYTERAHRELDEWLQTLSGADRAGEEFRVDQSTADSYLDRPIPSSAPAPEPRAPANITQRERRRAFTSEAVREDTTTKQPLQPANGTHHVPAAPVPQPAKAVEVDHSPAPESAPIEDAPPSTSIDSAFLSNNMEAEAADTYESPISDIDQNIGGMPDEDDDKENIRDTNARQRTVTSQAGEVMPDAIAGLAKIRAGLEKLRQMQAKIAENSNPNAPPHSLGNELKPKALADHSVREYSSAPLKEREKRISNPEPQANMTHMERREGSIPGQRPVSTVTAHAEVEQSMPARPDVRMAPPTRPVYRCEPQQDRDDAKQKPSPDFVRAPVSFSFAPTAAPAHHVQQLQPPQLLAKSTEALRQRREQPTGSAKDHLGLGAPPHRPTQEAAALPGAQHLQRHAARSGATEETPSVPAPHQQKPFSLNDGISAPVCKPAAPPSALQGQSRQAPLAPSSNAELTPSRRHTVLNPKPDRVQAGVVNKMVYSFCLVLGAIFGISGLIQAATKVRDAYEYHSALLSRINQFESSIVESYDTVRKMDEKYSVWSEYVRELTEQDESNALYQLESIQVEVEKWQTEMKNDLIEFKRSLSGDIIDAALSQLRDSNSTIEESTSTAPTP